MALYRISFEIDGKLVVLIEHQSTINPNMALRLLMYIGRVYEKIIEGRNIYSGKDIKIPRPQFFVLYNGVEPYPDEKIYKLSEMFENLESLRLAEKDFLPLGLVEKDIPDLELVVRVININEGRNGALAARCKKLAEYSAFVAKVRAYEKELGSLEEAIKATVKYCQKHDILKEFLELHAGEVLSMLMTEWNMDDALAVRYEEGHEDGREEGLEEGIAKGREEGWENGLEAAKESIARNLLAEGATPDFIQKITGLDIETIKNL